MTLRAAAFLALALPALLGATPFDKGGVLGAGAAAMGQAGAVVARPDLPTALWWNPAGLGLRHDFQLEAGYGDLLGGLRFDTDVSHRGWIEEAGLGYGIGYRRQGFTVDAAEDEYAFGVAFPFTMDGRLKLGLTLRALQARVLDLRAPGYGIDLGLHYQAPEALKPLSVGVAIRDVQAALEWPSGPRADPAQLFQVGAAWSFDPSSSVEMDSEFVSDPNASGRGSQGFKLGAEHWWSLPRYGLTHLVGLRLGYLQNDALIPSAVGGLFTAGLGLQAQGFSVDYAYTQDGGSQGASHRISADYAFGPAGPGPQTTPVAAATPVAKIGLALLAVPTVFNPSLGGKLKLSVISEHAEQVASSLIEIRPLVGPAVASKRVDGLPQDFVWDGRRPEGGEALAGGYRATLNAFDAQGNTLAGVSASFTLEAGSGRLRLSPEADIFAPIPQSVRQEARLAVGYDAADAQRWTLSVRKAGGTQPLRVISGKGLPRALAWNGRDQARHRVADGDYALTLQVLTQAGNTVTAKADVSVDTRRPKLSLEGDPQVFKTGGSVASVYFKTGLVGQAGIPARWSLKVEDLDGKALKSFAGAGSPPQGVAWNGVNEAGEPVAPGRLYYADFKVEMESGALAALPRLSLASQPEEPSLPFRVPLQTLRFNEGEEVIALDDFAGLKEAAAAVKKYSSDYVVQVAGHAQPGESGNGGLGELELSFLRAKAVRDYLVESQGLDPKRVHSSGFGASQALDGPDPSRDRRVEVILYAQ